MLHPLGYVRVRTIRVLGTVLSVFVRAEHLLHLRDIQTSVQKFSK